MFWFLIIEYDHYEAGNVNGWMQAELLPRRKVSSCLLGSIP